MKKAILFTLVLAGCAVGPNYEKPATPQPLKYKEAGTTVEFRIPLEGKR